MKSELFATGLPLGLFPESVYETRCLPEGELFGAERTLDVIRSSLGARSSDMVEKVYRAVRAFENGEPQRDDVTTVVLTCLLGT